MALPWDYETWPKSEESEEELKRAKLQDEEFESWLKIVCICQDEWPELIDED